MPTKNDEEDYARRLAAGSKMLDDDYEGENIVLDETADIDAILYGETGSEDDEK